jgi:glycosyltransferase involved in cell wall biosynthesis
MTVLFLSPSAERGGAERVLLTMTAALRDAHPAMPLHVLLLGDGPLTAQLQAQGVATSCLHLPPEAARLGDSQLALGVARGKLDLCRQGVLAVPGMCEFLRGFGAMVRRLRPALVHSNGIKTHVLVRLAGLDDDLPVVWHVHDFYGARPLARRLLRWSARRMHAGVAVSSAVAADLRTVVQDRPVIVVPNAIDTGRFRPLVVDTARLDALAGMPPAPPTTLRVGLVATYARWKGHDVFLHAAAHLMRSAKADADPRVRFYIIGGPVYQTDGSQFSAAELHGLAAALGIDRHCGFIGFQPDPWDVYPALDIVVHASTRPEPFGLTIVEAMACGRAVIATAAGGAAELVAPGQDALAVPPGDPAALAGALERLQADAELRQRLGASARATAVARFDAARLGPQLTAVYRQVLEPPVNLRGSFKRASLAAQLLG